MKKLLYAFLLIPMFGCSHSDSISPQAKPAENNQHPQISELAPLNYAAEQMSDPIKTGVNKKKEIKEKVILNVPLINQNPELKYGCEVTSLAMVLQYAGVKTTKMDLYKAVKKDNDPLIRSKRDIIRWGNPAEGFVGDMTGRNAGYAVFDKPLADLVNHYLPGRAINLTDRNFEEVLDHVTEGYPAVVWTTGDYRLPDRWESWTHGGQTIKTPLDLHAVVLVGFDQNNVYLNDPLSGKKQVKVAKERFISSWKALKSRAVSYQ